MGWVFRRRHGRRLPGRTTPSPDPHGTPEPAEAGAVANGVVGRAERTGAATASLGGFANTGVYLSVRQEGQRRLARWPHLIGVVPGRALGFQERAEAVRLRAALGSESTAVVGQVLSGLGGVGKTQLVADVARTMFEAGELDVLVWVTAVSRQAVVDAYIRAAVDLLGVEPCDQAAAAFLSWLQPAVSRPVCRWLVVLDDVADPGDLTGLWPPACPSGRAVVTTQRRDAALSGSGRRRVDVGVFTPSEAVAALGEALAERDHPPQRHDDLRALAEALGFLPLALSQAAAYIADAALSCDQYLALLAERTRLLAELMPGPALGQPLPDDQAGTVAATWSLSIDRADALLPTSLARPMLLLAAFLDPNGIPDTVLTSSPAVAHLADWHSGAAGSGHVTAEQAMLALRALHRLSLIEHTPATPAQAIRVHQLVQRAVRDTLTPDQHDRIARTAAAMLQAVWPDVQFDTTLVQALRANTRILSDHAEVALHRPVAHEVLHLMGNSLGEAGQVAAARDHFHRLTETTLHHLGPDHASHLIARNNFARWQAQAGDPVGAVSEFTDLLENAGRVFAESDFHTFVFRGNLAFERGRSGDPFGARDAFAVLLDDVVPALGEDHYYTLIVRCILARWHGETGEPSRARDELAEVLKDMVRVLGEDHPHTLTARGNLAYWQGYAGDPAGAIASLNKLLEDRRRELGPNHPATLTTRVNLALCQYRAGDLAGATAALAELLEDMVRVLGEDHPHTRDVRSRLASWQGPGKGAAGPG